MKMRELIGAYSAFRQLYRELQGYTDAELAEIGLRRSDNAKVAFAAALEGTDAGSRTGQLGRTANIVEAR